MIVSSNTRDGYNHLSREWRLSCWRMQVTPIARFQCIQYVQQLNVFVQQPSSLVTSDMGYSGGGAWGKSSSDVSIKMKCL